MFQVVYESDDHGNPNFCIFLFTFMCLVCMVILMFVSFFLPLCVVQQIKQAFNKLPLNDLDLSMFLIWFSSTSKLLKGYILFFTKILEPMLTY